ncbi:MAG TPA: bifunctional hydroxymethylpyrimidine kinase/phosphomethylpyrimidine kinase [Noviherbaspirillum sp.]|nr:bifunctional hydroxymethylpyrimidine kinase/phosphomethylpyrimidine kinase [Noviherbaspirillum sp.]
MISPKQQASAAAIPWRYPRVLSIAGSDSGGGAGIQADLKTCSALGCFGMTAITAITAQNTCGVSGIHAIPAAMLASQIDAVASDIGIDAVKIGMLHDPAVVDVVAQAIRRYRWPHVVLDPVMVATSGDRLIAEETLDVLVRELFPLASVVTPNLDEVALLLGRPVQDEDQFEGAARELLQRGAQAVLLKGGHLPGVDVVDLLVQSDASPLRLSSARIDSRNTHGTGCTLSSALACYLALGQPLAEAVRAARAYILQAIAQGADVQTGHGHGPLNHFHTPLPMRKLPLR